MMLDAVVAFPIAKRRDHAPSRGRQAALTLPRRFEAMLDRHQVWLRRVVLGVVADPSRVDDVLQEAFIRAYRGLPSRFESDRQEAAWLYRIVYRCCLDELRRRKRRRETPGIPEETPGANPDVIGSLAVLDALSTLSPEGRAAVLLVDLIGLDYATAATALGVPRGTVASRLNAARAHLRAALVLEGGDTR